MQLRFLPARTCARGFTARSLKKVVGQWDKWDNT